MLAYRLTYRSGEAAATVVLLHAFPFSSSMWDLERKELSHYANILAPDLPGFGASASLEVPSIAEMARQVAELLDHLKIQEPVVMGGMSMGGYVALEFMRQFPERMRGLMLFSTRATEDTPEGRKKRFQTIEEIEKGGLEAFAEKMAPKMLSQSTVCGRPDVVDKLKAMILANRPEGLTAALRSIAARRDLMAALRNVPCPSLIVAGEEDEIVAPAEGQNMHEKTPGSEFYNVPQAGHLVHFDRPGVFAALVENFLEMEIFSHAPFLHRPDFLAGINEKRGVA